MDINNENTTLTTKHSGHCGNFEVLRDGEGNKLWTNQGPETWIIADFNEKKTIAGIGIRSANDDPPEDPKTVVILVPKEDGSDEWREVATVKPEFDGKRRHLLKFVIPETITKKVKFDFSNGDTSHGQSIIQVGQL